MAARAAQLVLFVDQLMTALRTIPPVLAGKVFVGWRGMGILANIVWKRWNVHLASKIFWRNNYFKDWLPIFIFVLKAQNDVLFLFAHFFHCIVGFTICNDVLAQFFLQSRQVQVASGLAGQADKICQFSRTCGNLFNSGFCINHHRKMLVNINGDSCQT